MRIEAHPSILNSAPHSDKYPIPRKRAGFIAISNQTIAATVESPTTKMAAVLSFAVVVRFAMTTPLDNGPIRHLTITSALPMVLRGIAMITPRKWEKSDTSTPVTTTIIAGIISPVIVVTVRSRAKIESLTIMATGIVRSMVPGDVMSPMANTMMSSVTSMDTMMPPGMSPPMLSGVMGSVPTAGAMSSLRINF